MVDPVVPVGRHPLLGELGYDVVHLLLEDLPGMLLLDLLGEHERPPVDADPPLYGVDLVQRDDERSLVLPQDAYGFDGLGHQPFPDVDYQDREIREGPSSGAERDE